MVDSVAAPAATYAGLTSRFINRMKSFISPPPETLENKKDRLAELIKAYDTEITRLDNSIQAITNDIKGLNQDDPQRKKLEAAERAGLLSLENLNAQRGELQRGELKAATLPAATTEENKTEFDALDKLCRNALASLDNHHRVQPPQVKIMAGLNAEYLQEEIKKNIDAFKAVAEKSKDSPVGPTLENLYKEIIKLEAAKETLTDITSKMCNADAAATYSSQKNYKDALENANNLCASIATKLANPELIESAFYDQKKSSELNQLTQYLAELDMSVRKISLALGRPLQQARTGDIPVLGASQKVTVGMNEECGITERTYNKDKNEWETKNVLDKDGNAIKPTMAELIAVITELNAVEQKRCAQTGEKFRPIEMTKNLFSSSDYTIEHHTSDRRKAFNAALREKVELRPAAPTKVVQTQPTPAPTSAPTPATPTAALAAASAVTQAPVTPATATGTPVDVIGKTTPLPADQTPIRS